MKKLVVTMLALAAVSVGCRVEKVQEGKLPEVEVAPGKLPDYDVDTAKVEVRERAAEVNVPDVDVHTEKREITVPDVDVQMPSEQAPEQR